MTRLRLLAALAILAGALLFAAPAYASSRGDTGSGAVGVPVHSNDPTAGARDCTEADKRNGSGIQLRDGRAVIEFELLNDCVVSLWSYAQNGPGHPPVDSDVARGIGRHTLSVRACAQVDFVPGATHEQGSGEAFTFEHFDNDCEVPPSTTTTGPPSTTTSTSVTSVPTTSPSAPPSTNVPCAARPPCENPDAPEHSPAQLAVGGYEVSDAVPWLFFVAAGGLLVGAGKLWGET